MSSIYFSLPFLAIVFLAFGQADQVTVSVAKLGDWNANCRQSSTVGAQYSVNITNSGPGAVCTVVINVEPSTSGCCDSSKGQFVAGSSGLTALQSWPSKQFQVPDGTEIAANSSYDDGKLILYNCVGQPIVTVVSFKSC